MTNRPNMASTLPLHSLCSFHIWHYISSDKYEITMGYFSSSGVYFHFNSTTDVTDVLSGVDWTQNIHPLYQPWQKTNVKEGKMTDHQNEWFSINCKRYKVLQALVDFVFLLFFIVVNFDLSVFRILGFRQWIGKTSVSRSPVQPWQ